MGSKQITPAQPQLPPLSEAQIRQHASAESFARGADYERRGAVGQLVLRGDLLQTEVEGSEYEPYRVTVSLDAGGVRAASCSCPYDWGGWCKHIVATLLAYIHAAPGAVVVRPPLAELLAGLDRGQLEGLLLRLAAHDAELIERIDALLAAPPAAAATGNAEGAAVASGRRTAVDAAAFRQQIRRIFRAERPDDYMAYASILANLAPLVAQIQAFLDGDDAQSALPLLEALTDEYSDAWVDYDDSDGELGGFFDELGALWAAALLGANPKKAELKRWRERLEGWAASAEEYGCEGFGIALQAADEGWSEPWIDAAIIGEARPDRRPTGAYADELLAIRLRILERSGHTREALNLAAAAGMAREQALLLLGMGRVDEAVALGREQLSSAEEALEIAQALRERGEPAHALTIGEHGLSLGGSEPTIYAQEHARARLAAWLVDLAAGQGRSDLALRAGAEALRVAPELALYLRLAELASADWPELRERLLTALRASKSWMVAGRIDIFLHEGLIDDAIAALGQHPSGDDLARVMDAALATRPDWVIAAATASAAAIIDAGKAQHYGSAIEWLRRARAAYQAAGRQPEWQAHLQGLRAQHGRKYKLMGLLDQLERARR
ncbi:MAG: SWIM zinc finger domain-containing protein [Chloroflexi bacterium]|nr:SWIM zinc finger domain-containing protein [Chloroflexota bacterium]